VWGAKNFIDCNDFLADDRCLPKGNTTKFFFGRGGAFDPAFERGYSRRHARTSRAG
jgi:hypothetical protein